MHKQDYFEGAGDKIPHLIHDTHAHTRTAENKEHN